MFGMFKSLKRLMLVRHLGISANFPLASSAVSLWRFVATAVGTPLKKVIDLNAFRDNHWNQIICFISWSFTQWLKDVLFQESCKIAIPWSVAGISCIFKGNSLLSTWFANENLSGTVAYCTLWMIAKDYWIGRIEWGGSLANSSVAKLFWFWYAENLFALSITFKHTTMWDGVKT